MANTLPSNSFRRADESDDALFYGEPRKVVHIDEGAIAAASRLYGDLLPPNAVILDLMSAWRTHLPADYHATRVTGLGMNAGEMQDNPQLNDFVVHNLNTTPRLPFADTTFDASICTVSIQYLVKPVQVFADLCRVLKPKGIAIFTFSNRCFPTKAVEVWQSITMKQKADLIAIYFKAAGFANVRSEDRSPTKRRGLFGSTGDPLIGVWAYRPAGAG